MSRTQTSTKGFSEIDLFDKLINAYESSTHSNNMFEKVIKEINWDNTFEEDGELYYLKGNFLFVVENINPFEETRKPTAIFSDGSNISF